MTPTLVFQEKINKMHQQVKYGRFDLDAKIQSSKEFRNPSIYEKLLSHVGIDEKGTNYPPVSHCLSVCPGLLTHGNNRCPK